MTISNTKNNRHRRTGSILTRNRCVLRRTRHRPRTDSQGETENRGHDAPEQLFDVGESFKVKKFASPKDRIFRRGFGAPLPNPGFHRNRGVMSKVALNHKQW